MIRTVIVAAAVGVASACVPAATAHQDGAGAVVRIESGAVRGVVATDHRTFHAVPYAAAPTGERRWRTAVPVVPWTGVRDAATPGPACAQTGVELGRPSTTEDCLTVDVTTPTTPGRKPVLVWLHGGSFADGAADLYGGAPLAARGDVVVVSVQYRLGPLGFLAHPDLGPDAGDLGLADQQAALRWVRRNVAAFGGDPSRITLAGESAGATAVCAHLSAPGSRGLLHRAILQSGPCTRDGVVLSPAEAQVRAEQLGAAVGCVGPDAAACLRATPVPALLDAATGLGLGPRHGGRVLPRDPADAVRTGAHARVPVLLGITRDEERLMLWGEELATGPLTAAGYRDAVRAEYGDRAAAVLAEYPCDRDDCAAVTWASVRTDDRWARPLVDTADLLGPRVPTYRYEFADRDAPFLAGFPRPSFPMGAFHTAELSYLFDVPFADPLDPAQQRLSAAMVDAWARFMHTGEPGWPRTQTRAFAPDRIAPVDLRAEHRYAFWSELR